MGRGLTLTHSETSEQKDNESASKDAGVKPSLTKLTQARKVWKTASVIITSSTTAPDAFALLRSGHYDMPIRADFQMVGYTTDETLDAKEQISEMRKVERRVLDYLQFKT